MIDANRVEHFGKRYCRLADVDLVIANPDVVVGVAVDDEYFEIGRRRTDFVALARSPKGGPEPCESSTENDNARHVIFPNVRLELNAREGRNQA